LAIFERRFTVKSYVLKNVTMRTILVMAIVLFGLVGSSNAQQSTTWNKWNWLMGEWVGDGGGQPGQGGGAFSFTFDLDKKVVIRKSHSEFKGSEGKPAVVHDDLMVVYLDFNGSPSKAIYFDNEGHTISYTVTYPNNAVVLVSDRIPNVPIFRLSYIPLEDGSVNVKFEMSKDGEKFMTYVEGKSRKK
jgi:hypothetical protein